MKPIYYIRKQPASRAAAHAVFEQSQSRNVLFRRIDKLLGQLPPSKIVMLSLLACYIAKNLLHILFLNAPEPATWIMTSLDAGFLTCMPIRPLWLREILSPLMSAVYLFFPEAADEKVRRYRHNATVEQMRYSWEKSTNLILYWGAWFDRGWLGIRKDIRIPLPKTPSHSVFAKPKSAINARLYFNGTTSQLAKATQLIFHVPGGGFVCMTPKNHDEYLSNWARQIGVPIVSINYGKAPEFPYPWGIEECFDAYRSIVESNGQVIGLDGWQERDGLGRKLRSKSAIKIIMVGDSAGANIATSTIFRCLESTHNRVKAPAAFISIYPCLSFDMACWMPSQQINLLRAESHNSLSSIFDKKMHIRKLAPLETADAPRAIDVFHDQVDRRDSWYHRFRPKMFQPKSTGPYIPSALSMTSRMSYSSDRILTPELLRGMALLYLAGSPLSADIATDYYLSPVIAPDELLSRFPKTYLIAGEKDPLMDDVVVFAARLREAKAKARREWERLRVRRRNSGTFSGATQHHHSLSGDGGASNGGDLGRYSNTNGNLTAATNGNGDVHESDSEPDEQPEGIAAASANDHDFDHHVFSQHPDEMVRVKILEGVSHAFFQMTSFLPEAKQATRLTAEWFKELFRDSQVDSLVGVASNEAPELTQMMVQRMESGILDANISNWPYYNTGVGPAAMLAARSAIQNQWISSSAVISPDGPAVPSMTGASVGGAQSATQAGRSSGNRSGMNDGRTSVSPGSRSVRMQEIAEQN
eukprot:jgi/Hompol1/2364/HPOL_002918-RA